MGAGRRGSYKRRLLVSPVGAFPWKQGHSRAPGVLRGPRSPDCQADGSGLCGALSHPACEDSKRYEGPRLGRTVVPLPVLAGRAAAPSQEVSSGDRSR